MSFITIQKTAGEEKAEDGYNAASASYVTAPPSGVLSVHIKSLKLDESHFMVPDPEVYIRVRVGTVTKSTVQVYPQKTKPTTIVNDLKNFSLTLSRDRSAPQNEVRIDLIMVVTQNVHRILGHKDMHIYDIIKFQNELTAACLHDPARTSGCVTNTISSLRSAWDMLVRNEFFTNFNAEKLRSHEQEVTNLYVAGTYDLRYRNQHIAYIEVEMCFAYGIFGFGYSHQLENRQANIADIVSHSFLYREDPPDNRQQSNGLVMTPVHMAHPDFINFIEKVKVGPAARQEPDTLVELDPFEDLEKEEPSILLKRMTKRLNRIQADYSQLTDRAQRKKFLEKLILRKVEDQQSGEPAAGDLHSNSHPPGYPRPSSSHKKGNGQELPNSDFVTLDQTATEYEQDDDMNIHDVSTILATAPGILAGRTQRNRRVAALTSIMEDNGSDSTITGSEASHGSSRDLQSSKGGRRQSTAGELPSVVLRSFSDRLRLWRDRRIGVASEDHPSEVAISEDAGMQHDTLPYRRWRSTISRLAHRFGSGENNE